MEIIRNTTISESKLYSGRVRRIKLHVKYKVEYKRTSWNRPDVFYTSSPLDAIFFYLLGQLKFIKTTHSGFTKESIKNELDEIIKLKHIGR